ncbi:hypothetical protein DHX103_11310 [Planococcus sp. X10-3]|uniref:hypothetical protein n=1 Tax=Planococcus sp. X10-3 TaxID=3061240 RepID=UPI003BB15637
MTKKTKKIILSLAGTAVLFLLLMTWFYPYSAFGISKSYSFTPDPVVVDGYEEDLNEFKSSYEKDFAEMEAASAVDLTIDRTQYVLPLFEQDWLLSKEPVSWSMDDLDYLILEVRSARTTLLELSAAEDYAKEHRQNLVDSIESLLWLEEQIEEIKTGKAESRKTLNIQFGNLHMSFLNNFMMFNIFYDRSRNE